MRWRENNSQARRLRFPLLAGITEMRPDTCTLDKKMDPTNTQDLIEKALESSIEAMDLLATDDNLNKRLREAQEICQAALMELRGYGHEVKREEWQQ
jgi:hypothetical protein